ncbi:MAG: hypothetical protein ABW003_05815, partial [Microvirga sp.]
MIGDDSADKRLADGLTGDIITDLARSRDLTVIARASTEGYRGRPVDPREVGRDLKVRYVLEGSLQRQAGQLRFNTQLVDAGTAATLWSERYDRKAKDLFEIQSEIADRIVATVSGYRGLVKVADTSAMRRKAPDKLDAYELYLLAQDISYGLAKASLEVAVQYYRKALSLDPKLARAYIGLAHSFFLLSNMADDGSDLRRLQLEAARRAADLDPDDSLSHIALGQASGSIGDFAAAEREFDQAIRISPNSFDGLAAYASWASALGKPEAGADAADKVIRLNPNFPMWNARDFKYAYFMVGRYADAIKVMERIPEDKWAPGDYVMVGGRVTHARQDRRGPRPGCAGNKTVSETADGRHFRRPSGLGATRTHSASGSYAQGGLSAGGEQLVRTNGRRLKV